MIRPILEQRLPRFLGNAFDDVREIRVDSDRQLTFLLNRRTSLLVDALDGAITKPGPSGGSVGTGPFKLASPADPARLVANTAYAEEAPALAEIDLKRYDSVRAAWADLLRGNVDMLYEVGLDALDSLEPASDVEVFSYRRHYQFVLLFNVKRPALRDAAVRRALNAAVDRQTVIDEALGGRGTASAGPIWPEHWAAPPDLAPVAYAPRRLADSGRPIHLACLVVDPTHERAAIAVQRQLQSVGVHLDLVMPGTAEAMRQLEARDFDVILTEIISAPNLLRPYLFWSSKGPYNYGGYSSAPVDAALEAVLRAPDDEAYRKGVADFQRAIVDDPPAIFLAWTQRARAVSTAFEVPVEPGRDPLTTLRLWRPAGVAAETR